MHRGTAATREVFLAGCVLLGSIPRAGADDVLKIWSPVNPYLPEQRLHLMPMPGPLGPSLQYRYDLSRSLKLRLEYASPNAVRSDTRHYVNYELNNEMVSQPLILDWHPYGGAFRASAGIVFGHPKLSATASYDRTMTVSGVSASGSKTGTVGGTIEPGQTITVRQYTVKVSDISPSLTSVDANQSYAQNVVTGSSQDLARAHADVRYPSYAPYIGIGWGNLGSDKDRLLYSIDIGAMYLQRPQVQLSLSGPGPDLADRAYTAATQAYLAQEQEKIEQEFSKYRYFPVLSVGLWYRF